MKRGFWVLILLITFGVLPAFLNNVCGEEKTQSTTGLRIAKGIYKGKEVAFVEGEILVKFKGESESRLIKVPDGKVIEEVEQYQKREDVEYAQPNFVYNGGGYLQPFPPLPKAEGTLNGKKIKFIDGRIRVKYKGEKDERIIKVPEGQVIEKVLEWRQKKAYDKNIEYVEPDRLSEYDMVPKQ